MPAALVLARSAVGKGLSLDAGLLWGGAQGHRGGDAASLWRGSQQEAGEQALGGQGKGCQGPAQSATGRVPRGQRGRGGVLAAGGRYLLHDVAVAVAGSQVQRGVVTAVHDVDACSPHDKHVNHVGAALTAGPVQGAEAVVIPVGTAGTALLSGCSLPAASSPDPGRESPAEHGDSTTAGQVSPCTPARGPWR